MKVEELAMKNFLRLGDIYASESNWKDFALVKFCLFAMGIIVGVNAPKKYRKPITIVSLIVFLSTYIPLMAKVFRIIKDNDIW